MTCVWRSNELPLQIRPIVEDRGWPFFEAAVFYSSDKAFRFFPKLDVGKNQDDGILTQLPTS